MSGPTERLTCNGCDMLRDKWLPGAFHLYYCGHEKAPNHAPNSNSIAVDAPPDTPAWCPAAE